MKDALVSYHSVFARHRFDIGINTEFKIKLTPKHDEPVWTRSLPTPINLREDLLVELALMQEYDIITTLPHSKYSSPLFAQRKPNGKLRLLVDLRRINHLIKNDYNEHNHPVSTLEDAAQHMAGKRYFSTLTALKHTFAFRWQTNSQFSYYPLTSVLGHLHLKD